MISEPKIIRAYFAAIDFLKAIKALNDEEVDIIIKLLEDSTKKKEKNYEENANFV